MKNSGTHDRTVGIVAYPSELVLYKNPFWGVGYFSKYIKFKS